MRVMDEGDYIVLLLSHGENNIWQIKGHVKHRNDTEVVIDVENPSSSDVITVAEVGVWEEDMTAFRGRTSVRIGSVVAFRLLKVTGTRPTKRRLNSQAADD